MNDNELDNLIKNIYSKKINEPPEFEMAIRNAFKDKKKSYTKQRILKFVPALCSFFIIISGIVYAKDIERYFKNLFTNTTESIDSAVENGYFQNIDMDFVYDNDIGIKADNLVLDDLNLDISFCYETKNKSISSICLEKYKITNDNKELIYEYDRNSASSGLSNFVSRKEKELFRESILLGLKETEQNFNRIHFEIKSLTVTYMDETRDDIKGDWQFDITINDEMKKEDNIYYILSDKNEYVESCTGKLTPTGMYIKLKLVNPIEHIQDLLMAEIFSLKNNFKIFKTYDINILQGYGNIENIHASEFSFKYNNIGKYSENINLEEFEFYIEVYDTTVILKRVYN